MYSFAKSLRKANHTLHYSIRATNSGWEVREEQDSQVVRQKRYVRLAPSGARPSRVQHQARSAPTGRLAGRRDACFWPQQSAQLSSELRHSLDEAISQAHHGFDLLARRAELGAQPSDVDVDRTRLDDAVVAPHALEQSIAREHAIAVLDEVAEQLELSTRQSNGAPSTAMLTASKSAVRWRPRYIAGASESARRRRGPRDARAASSRVLNGLVM